MLPIPTPGHILSHLLSLSRLRIVLMDDAMDCLMSFSDFLFAFQIQFYYSGESFPGPHVAPARATCACPALVPFPSGAWHTHFPPPLPPVEACFATGPGQDV